MTQKGYESCAGILVDKKQIYTSHVGRTMLSRLNSHGNGSTRIRCCLFKQGRNRATSKQWPSRLFFSLISLFVHECFFEKSIKTEGYPFCQSTSKRRGESARDVALFVERRAFLGGHANFVGEGFVVGDERVERVGHGIDAELQKPGERGNKRRRLGARPIRKKTVTTAFLKAYHSKAQMHDRVRRPYGEEKRERAKQHNPSKANT